MKKIIHKCKLLSVVMLCASACLLLVSCARYARTVDTLYEPSATVRGGSGEIYILIPEERQTNSAAIKWVIGRVKDDDNNTIDEVYSPRSPAEIIQEALSLEFKKAGYQVQSLTKRPASAARVIDLTKTVIDLEQISDLADLKATCRVLMAVDVYINNQQIKRLQYDATSSRTDITDRDLLARSALEDALQSVMREAMPDLHNLFK